MESEIRSASISVAILPFQNMSEDKSIDVFSLGLTMDIINDLSRFREFQIISYDAVKSLHPNEKPETGTIAHLGIDYAVKGLLRYRNEKLLINLQLINVRKNRLVWAEKFSSHLEELSRIQEEIVERIIFSLQRFVGHDLIYEVRKKPLSNLNAYECWIKGWQELKKGSLEADETAREFFKKAIEIDPYFSRAYTGMSLSYFNEWSCQIWDRWEVSQKGAFEWAKKAIELDEWDHVSAAIVARIFLFNGEYDNAERLFRKALNLNPNDWETLTLISMGMVYLGYLEEAHGIYDRLIKINPIENDEIDFCGAFIFFEMGRFHEALALFEKLSFSPRWVDFFGIKAAAYFHIGEFAKMEQCLQAFTNEFTEKINGNKPATLTMAIRWMINVNPFRKGTRLEPFWQKVGKGMLVKNKETEKLPQTNNRFIKEGGLWSVDFAGKQVMLPELKGIHDIVRLLESPNQQIHCTELMGAEVIEKGEEVFDQKARQTYQRRILELQQEIEEAETTNAGYVAETLHKEYDKLLEHLSASVGKGGATRKVSGSIEKARTAVTWRIRNAIKKIKAGHPSLGKHLEVSVKTGVFCVYSPEKEVHWEL